MGFLYRVLRTIFADMEPDAPVQSPDLSGLLPPEEAFEWPRHASRHHNWEQAAARWQVLRHVYPDHPACWFQGVNALTQSAKYDKAEDLLARAREQFPNHPSFFAEAGFLDMQRGDLDSAQESLTKARTHLPKNFMTWVWSAQLAEQMGDYDAALVYACRATECAPERAGLFIEHANLTMRAERYEEAIEQWELINDRFPGLDAAYKGLAQAQRMLDGADEAQPESTKQDAPGLHAHPIRLIELIWTKAIFNLHSEVRRNYLSFGWWVLEPLMHLAVYQIVFGVLLFRGGPGFLLFLMVGVVSWMWTMKCISGSSGSISGGQNLMFLVGVPPIVFPSVCLLQATIKQIPVFLLLIGFVLFNGSSPGLHWFALIPILIVHALLNIALSLAIAAVTPMVRDLQQIIPTGLTLLMFMSGIFYDYETFDQKWHALFLLNPVAFILKCYRDVFIGGTTPDMAALAGRGAICAVACVLFLMIYKRLRYFYPRVVME